MQAIFDVNFEFFEFFPSFSVDEDPADRQPEGLFGYYDISPYIINNLGPFIANCIGIYLISIFFVFIHAVLSEKNDVLDSVLYSMRRFLIWSFVISYSLSNYLSSCLYSVTALRWYSFQTSWGTANFCIGLVLSAFTISTPLLIFLETLYLKRIYERERQEYIDKHKMMADLGRRLKSIDHIDRSTKKNFSQIKISNANRPEGSYTDLNRSQSNKEGKTELTIKLNLVY